MESEKIIYEGHPSQLRNLKVFFLAGLLAGAIVAGALLADKNWLLLLLLLPLGYAGWHWLLIQTTKLTLTAQRIIVSEGVLNKTTNETELYRVRDTSVQEPLLYRLLGLGNVIVFTTDEAKATHTFAGYQQPHWLKDQIRNYSEECRKRNRWGNDNILLHDQIQG